MRFVEEFRKNAEECRRLASTETNAERRRAIEKLAKTWETLAAARGEELGRQPRAEKST